MKKQEHMNRMWWMASAVVLLFVAAAVAPVAAYDVFPLQNNHTYIPMANPPIKYNSTYLGNPYYYVNLTNTTGGMNAIHISDSYAPANAKGTCYEKTSADLNGTFYVTDTGGKGGQDDIVLLIAVNSADLGDPESQIDSVSINITASGYNWTPNSTGSPFPEVNYETPLSAKLFTSADFLKDSSGDLFQNWKFAPTDTYPIYCGQDMTDDSKSFKLIAIDTKVGTINGTWYNETYDPDLALENNGYAKITYNITKGDLTNRSIIAFNTYAYNNKTITQKKGDSLPPAVNWLNLVKTSEQSSWTNASGWMITI